MSPNQNTFPQPVASDRRWLSAMSLLCLVPAMSAQAADPNQPFCIPNVINVPGPTLLQPPNIDGVVSDDLGWTNARRHVFINGTPVFDAAIQALRDPNFLYFSFEVNHDTQFDTKDEIYVAFDPSGAPADRRLLRINPVVPAGAVTPVPMAYWQGYPWNGLGAAAPAGTAVAVTTSGTAPNVSWTVELKVPRPAFGIPAAGPFGIYFNVVPQIDDLSFHYQYRWPEGTLAMAADPLNAPLPSWADTGKWGQATTAATTCNGVYIAASDIRTSNNPPSKINLNAPNTFQVTVHNGTVDAAGVPLAANNVRATFKIANFGLPSQWTPINATAPATNPTPSATIPASGSADISTQWTLSPAEAATYNTDETRHQCILVELDTNPITNTQFATRSAWTNMNFGLASTFESNASIDPRGWPKTLAGKPQLVELVVTGRTDELKAEEVLRQMTGREERPRLTALDSQWRSLAALRTFPIEKDDRWKEFVEKLGNPKARVSQSTYLFHGCRHTGQFLELPGGRKSELCERVGSYGYVVRHASLGDAIGWNLNVVDRKPKPETKARIYQVTISDEKPVLVRNQIVATEKRVSGNPDCGRLNLGSAGTLAAGFFFAGTGVFWKRRRKSK